MPRVRYDRLVAAGVFGPEDRIELLDGLLVAREPQGARHATVVAFVRAALEKALGRAFHVREENPISSWCRADHETTCTRILPGPC